MDAVLFQDWVIIGGVDAFVSVTQDASKYLDTSGAIDLVIWVQSSSVIDGGGRPTLSLETSALCEDGGFNLVTPEFGLAEGPPDIKVVRGYGSLPSASLLRWRVRNASALTPWSVSLRIFVSVSHCSSIPSNLRLKEPRRQAVDGAGAAQGSWWAAARIPGQPPGEEG